MENSQSVVFFDGVCNLCNGFVNFLMERKAPMAYASLQGTTAQRMLPRELREELSSVVYFREGEYLVRGKAITAIFKDLGGIYRFFGVALGALPGSLIDFMYESLAKKRYGLFGKRDTCRLPNENEKKFFLP